MSDNDDNVIDFAAAKEAFKKVEAAVNREKARASFVEDEWEKGLLFDPRGRVDKASGHNATLILGHHDAWSAAFRFDSFADKIVIAKDCPAGRAGEAWADLHDKRAADWLESSKYGLRPSKSTVLDSVNAVAHAREVHPVREYLRALEWDGVPRVNSFAAKYLLAGCSEGDEARAQYLAKVSAILLIGPVARVMRPGIMLRTVPILEGPQDLGKSRAIRALCPREEWFSDSEIPYGSKDAYQGLLGKWLIELSEIDKDLKGRHSASTIKAFISSPSDNYRSSYGRRNADHPRQGAFIGSTNHEEYLTDETGGSRFLPFACGAPPDVAAIVHDRDQLWAEAFRRFSDGEPWWIEQGNLLTFARDEQADRYAGDVWTARIQGLLEGGASGGLVPITSPPAQGITTEWVLTQLGFNTAQQGVAEQMRVCRVMTSLGWNHPRKRLGRGRRLRVWEPGPT